MLGCTEFPPVERACLDKCTLWQIAARYLSMEDALACEHLCAPKMLGRVTENGRARKCYIAHTNKFLRVSSDKMVVGGGKS